MSAALKPIPPEAEVSYLYRQPAVAPPIGGGLHELSMVTLRVAATTFDGETVPAGREGTIVMVHGDGDAFDVEFTSPSGVASVIAGDIVPVRA